MKQKNLKRSPINNSLTRTIIEFHELGFTEDFFIVENPCSLCSLYSPDLIYPSFRVLVINQFYDRLTGGYKYIHTIETDCGTKGILLTSNLFINKVGNAQFPLYE